MSQVGGTELNGHQKLKVQWVVGTQPFVSSLLPPWSTLSQSQPEQAVEIRFFSVTALECLSWSPNHQAEHLS